MGYAALNVYVLPGSAVSEEAVNVTRNTEAIFRFAEESQSLFGVKADAISQLKLLASECMESDWDGNSASAIDELAIQNAENFVRALPDNIPMPEFAPEPDGSISLDWIRSRHRMFSLSIGPNNRIAYAWLDGTDKGHAVARFDGRSISTRILDGIRATLGNENAFIGAV